MAVRGGHVPEGPDPNDRAASKRTWEKAMKEWRVELKRLVNTATPPGLLTNHGFVDEIWYCGTWRLGPFRLAGHRRSYNRAIAGHS